MPKYRLLEITDKLVNGGKLYWRIEKKILGLWWTDYFEEHSQWSGGATYYDKEEAMKWYEYHCDKKSRFTTKIIAQNG